VVRNSDQGGLTVGPLHCRDRISPGQGSAPGQFNQGDRNSIRPGNRQSPKCYYCDRFGHIKPNCPRWKEDQAKKGPVRPVTLVQSKRVNVEQSLPEKGNMESRNVFPSQLSESRMDLDPVPNNMRNFVSQGKVGTLTEGSASCCRPVAILRDTGASQSLMLADVLPLSEDSVLNAKVLIQGVGHETFTPVPLHRVYLDSDLVTGTVTVGVVPTLPVEGVSFLLGNDLAGDKVCVSPVVSEEPEAQIETERLMRSSQVFLRGY